MGCPRTDRRVVTCAEEKYELDQLIEIFKDHVIKAEKNTQEMIESFKENYPETPLPDHMTDDFNLPKALLSLSIEIEGLKSMIRQHFLEESPTSS